MVVARLGSDAVANSSQIVADCGHDAHLAPSGRALMGRRPQTRTVCIDCYRGDSRLHVFTDVRRAEGAAEELRAEVGPDGEDFVRWMQRTFKET